MYVFVGYRGRCFINLYSIILEELSSSHQTFQKNKNFYWFAWAFRWKPGEASSTSAAVAASASASEAATSSAHGGPDSSDSETSAVVALPPHVGTADGGLSLRGSRSDHPRSYFEEGDKREGRKGKEGSRKREEYEGEAKHVASTGGDGQ